MKRGTINYRDWAVELCTLLDRIEMVADDEEAVRELLQGRFDIARNHGFEVVIDGPASGRLN